MKLFRLTTKELLADLKENQLVTSVHVSNGAYAIAIGRQLVTLNKQEFKWFAIGLLVGAKVYDI